MFRVPDRREVYTPCRRIVLRDLWQIIYDMAIHGSYAFESGLSIALTRWKKLGFLSTDNLLLLENATLDSPASFTFPHMEERTMLIHLSLKDRMTGLIYSVSTADTPAGAEALNLENGLSVANVDGALYFISDTFRVLPLLPIDVCLT